MVDFPGVPNYSEISALSCPGVPNATKEPERQHLEGSGDDP